MDQSASLPLPLEIFTRIVHTFLSLEPPYRWLTSSDVRRHRLQSLRLVCRAWNDIVVNTRLLWSVISIHIGLRPSDTLANSTIVCSHQLTTHLERAGNNTPLDIDITIHPLMGWEDFESITPGLHTVIQQAMTRARRVSISAEFLDLGFLATVFLGAIKDSHPPLESLKILSGPWEGDDDDDVVNSPLAALPDCDRLDFLGLAAPLLAVVHSNSVTTFQFFHPLSDDIRVLPTRFPNLTHLYLTNPQDTATTEIHFPHLRFLHIQTFAASPRILDNISAPNLTRFYTTIEQL